MAHSFSELRKNANKNISTLKAAAEKLNKQSERPSDERFWQPSVDEHGNGSAIIRFLPETEGEDYPFVRYWTHAFEGPTGLWYIEKSLTSIGKDDPVSKLNSRLWKSGLDSDKEQVRKQKRKLHYVSNIYVIKDAANPQNEGKVFLYQYGKKIWDMIYDKMNPTFEDEQSVNPFDLWNGASFRLRIRKVDGYRNYDKSDFGEAGPLFDDDAKMEKVWRSQYKLNEFIDPANYPSKEELEDKLNRVLGLDDAAPVNRPARSAKKDDEEVPWAEDETPAPQPKAAQPKRMPLVEEDDDDEIARFRRQLAEDE